MIPTRRNRYLGPSSTKPRKREEAGRGEMWRETTKGTWSCEQSRGGVKGVAKTLSARGDGKGWRVSRDTVHGILAQTRRIEK